MIEFIQNAFSIFIGFLLADFFSGMGHWAEDRYFSEQTLLIGKYIIAPNRIHHQKTSSYVRIFTTPKHMDNYHFYNNSLFYNFLHGRDTKLTR